ncbi:MAG: hypothetical protein NT166_03385 [Candidatus Aminicenantes bacterium]|nr:hypothetical protein [Candidatus Aminicenantes bacterium]
MDKKRAEENLKFWKALVNLPDHFPKLNPLTDENVIDMMVINQEIEKTIFNSISSKPLTHVVVQKGSGLTTLYTYIFQKYFQRSFENLAIPVNFDLSVPEWEQNISSQWIEQEIKKQVIQNLIQNPWDNVLEEAYYFYCINYQEDTDFYAYRAEMLKFLSGRKDSAWRTFSNSFPFTKRRLDDFLNYLLDNLRIQTVVFYHFPGDLSDEQVILDFISAIKTIYEVNQFRKAAMREVYYSTTEIQRDLDREFKRDFNVIYYPRYTAAEIFAMLVKRYRPYSPGMAGKITPMDLSSVFSEEFVKKAWEEDISLAAIIKQIKKLMLERLDCDRKEVPYQLALFSEMMKKKDKSGIITVPLQEFKGETVPLEKKKRFTRMKREAR